MAHKKKAIDKYMKERTESSNPSPAKQTFTCSRPGILLHTSLTGSKPCKISQPFLTPNTNQSFENRLQSSANLTHEHITTTKRSYADSTRNIKSLSNKGATISYRSQARRASSSSESEDLPQGPFTEDHQYSSINLASNAATIQPQFVINNVIRQPVPLAQFHHQAVVQRPVLHQGQGFVYIMQPVQTLIAQTLPADQSIIQTLQVPLQHPLAVFPNL